VNPSISISSLVKDIKVASSKYIKDQHLFRHFEGWQDGYGAFTYSSKELKTLIQYVQNQEMHHKKRSFKEEYLQILMEHGIEPEPRYF
jgi:REP element-mobilizing transposase RayT